MPQSSSQPIREELVRLNERGVELLTEQKSFVPTARGEDESDTDRVKYLKRCLRTLNYEFADVNDKSRDTRIRIHNMHSKWITAREAMTGKERIDDNPIFDEFTSNHPYLDTGKELDKYAKKLQLDRDEIEDEPEELVGGDITIASAQSSPPPQAMQPAPTQSAPPSSGVRLKPIEIPTFGGDITEFPCFKETFTAATLGMAPVPQFLHLKAHLTGSALAAINELATNEQSIKDGWRILTAEFGNKCALQDALYNDLQNLKGTNGSAMDLRRFVDALEQICLKLTRAGENPDQRYLTNLIERKLPFGILQVIHKAKLAENMTHWTMTDLKQKLKDILRLRESMGRVLDQIHVENPKPVGQGRPGPNNNQQYRPRRSHVEQSSAQNPPLPR